MTESAARPDLQGASRSAPPADGGAGPPLPLPAGAAAAAATAAAGVAPGAADQPADPAGALTWRRTADGSPSLWSEAFAEAFHCGSGALAEARAKFVRPAQLERFRPGSSLRVVDVCVGLGYNSAALLEAATARGLTLQWWGLELDPRPLALALADLGFRRLWQPSTLEALEQLRDHGCWAGGTAGAAAVASGQLQDPCAREPGRGSRGRWWLGDARQGLGLLPAAAWGRCDLVLLDAFSPGRCPQLWTREFLARLAALLAPQGRLLTYCTAAAVRRGLELAGLELASVSAADAPDDCCHARQGTPALPTRPRWSDGTVASPAPLPPGDRLRPLAVMEREHLRTRAAVPYGDPHGQASAAAILADRLQRQEQQTDLESTSAWRRRWGLGR